tara:strand:- start:5725 stop:6441 length:717 start_codon:yes stop_codon:yes gene_type:complete
LTYHKYLFFSEKGYKLTKSYTVARTYLGLGRYATYKDFGEDSWKIGYGSKEINGHFLKANDKATQKEVDKQFYLDLKNFSSKLNNYVFVSLNTNRRAAILSFAYSIGIQSFKNCKLLDLINSYASKNKIIKEWSPYINTYWMSGGDLMIARRRAELDMFFAADKEIPTFYKHSCHAKVCLLNLVETYNGSSNQIKGIEYLEKKFIELDPSGEVLRRFFRYWNEKPSGLGSPKRAKVDP